MPLPKDVTLDQSVMQNAVHVLYKHGMQVGILFDLKVGGGFASVTVQSATDSATVKKKDAAKNDSSNDNNTTNNTNKNNNVNNNANNMLIQHPPI